jgi:hypothetical protein
MVMLYARGLCLISGKKMVKKTKGYIVKNIATIIAILFVISIPLHTQDSAVIPLKKLEKERLYFSIDEAMRNIDSAYRLCQGGQEIEELPEHLGDLTNMQYFNAAQNKLKQLPASFCQLRLLQEINLAGNYFTAMPVCIADMQFLQHLDFSANPDINWNEAISLLSQCPNLKELDLSMNDIEKFPEEFEFPKLTLLILSDNNFSESEKERIKQKLKTVNIIF